MSSSPQSLCPGDNRCWRLLAARIYLLRNHPEVQGLCKRYSLADLLEVLPGARKDTPLPRCSDICWLKRWQKLNFHSNSGVCGPSSNCRLPQMMRDSAVPSVQDAMRHLELLADVLSCLQHWLSQGSQFLNVNQCFSVPFNKGEAATGPSLGCCKGSPGSEQGIAARRHLYKITIFEKHLFIIVLLFGACGHEGLRKVCRLLGWPWGTVAAIISSSTTRKQIYP